MPSGTPSSRLALAVPIALAALTIAFTVRPLDDFDIWYHLAAGRLMMATGAWPATNTFAYTTPDHSWVDLHWLFQLLLYGAYNLGGVNGCIALTVGLMLATVALLYADGRRFAPPVVVAVPLAVALAVSSIRFVPRPEVLAFALFAAYLWLLDGYPRCGMAIYALVPLQLVWMNSHGTVPVGVGLIGCYWLGATLAFLPVPAGWRAACGCTRREWMHLTIVLVLASAVCFVNPWGAAGALLPLDLLRSVTGGSILSARIGEFRPPFGSGYDVLAYMWATLLAAAALSFLLNLRSWHLGRLLAVAAFGVLSSRALRNMALFAWVAVPAIAANVGGFLAARVGESRATAATASRAERRRAKTTPAAASTQGKGARTAPPVAAPAQPGPRARVAALASGRRAELAVVVALLVVTASVVTGRFSRFIGVEYEFGAGTSRLRFPAGAVEFAREVGIRGRPFNCFAMGGYLAWHVFPEERIFVDGRTQAYPETFFREYFQVMDNPASWPAVTSRYQPDYVLLYHVFPNRYPLGRYLSAGRGWQLVYYDENAALFLPTDDAHRETRERAERAFVEVQARRASAPLPPPPSIWGSLSVPVSEIVLQNAYGDFLRAFGKPAEAVVAYQRALFYDPDSSDTRFNLAMSYWFAGDRARSVAELRDLVRRDPGYARGQKALADALKMSAAPTAGPPAA